MFFRCTHCGQGSTRFENVDEDMLKVTVVDTFMLHNIPILDMAVCCDVYACLLNLKVCACSTGFVSNQQSLL